ICRCLRTAICENEPGRHSQSYRQKWHLDRCRWELRGYSRSMLKLKSLWSFAALAVMFPLLAASQSRISAPNARPNPEPTRETRYPTERFFFRNLLCDQEQIWQSPFRLRLKDASWLVPMAGVTTGLIVTDRTTSFELSRGNVNLSKHVSDA